MAVWVRKVLCTPRAHSPAVEVKNPQSQGEVGLHGRGAPGAGLLSCPSDRGGQEGRGVAAAPPAAARTGGRPRPRAPRKAVASKPAQLRPGAEARRPGPTPALPGQPVLWSQQAAHQAGKDVCGEIQEVTGGEGRPRAGPDRRRAGLRHAGRGAPRSSALKLVPDRGRLRALAHFSPAPARLTSNRLKRLAVTARPAPHPAPHLPESGEGGVVRLPWRQAVFVLGVVAERCHGERTALQVEAGPVHFSVAPRAAAAGEDCGALQKQHLSDSEEHS